MGVGVDSKSTAPVRLHHEPPVPHRRPQLPSPRSATSRLSAAAGRLLRPGRPAGLRTTSRLTFSARGLLSCKPPWGVAGRPVCQAVSVARPSASTSTGLRLGFNSEWPAASSLSRRGHDPISAAAPTIAAASTRLASSIAVHPAPSLRALLQRLASALPRRTPPPMSRRARSHPRRRAKQPLWLRPGPAPSLCRGRFRRSLPPSRLHEPPPSPVTVAMTRRCGLKPPSSKPPQAGPAVSAATTSRPCRAGLASASEPPWPRSASPLLQASRLRG